MRFDIGVDFDPEFGFNIDLELESFMVLLLTENHLHRA